MHLISFPIIIILTTSSISIRTSTYAKLTKCSTDTALRDLQDLVSKKMIITENSGKKQII